jgi:hypothetical protein
MHQTKNTLHFIMEILEKLRKAYFSWNFCDKKVQVSWTRIVDDYTSFWHKNELILSEQF